eukprot:CAMPEP_0116899440 /NCGR_PEP_ID=MMETSP0467-20121206/8008_1 /TAXON_ID=283647 /ORGANISM="Mesodinium pulex, Strain SPMC105" /LENGTH=32 /DNA_ID= /DNA_START= /DNA_END= /DNA_ORIENTATION=
MSSGNCASYWSKTLLNLNADTMLNHSSELQLL